MKLGLPFLVVRRRGLVRQINFRAQVRFGRDDFANGEPPQPLHDHDDPIVCLSQEFQDERSRAGVKQILRLRIFVRLVALREEADHFGQRQGFIEQLDRTRPADGERKHCPGEHDETAHRQDGQFLGNARLRRGIGLVRLRLRAFRRRVRS